VTSAPGFDEVFTGAPLDAIGRGNTEGILAGRPDSHEFRRFDKVPGEHRDC